MKSLLSGEAAKQARPAPFSPARVTDARWLAEVSAYFLYGGVLPVGELTAIVAAALVVIAAEPPIVDVKVAPGASVTILGDTHGQFDDLYTVLEVTDISDRNVLIFNGDLVDRGPKQLQLITMALLLKLAYPQTVFIVRGNHETRVMNEATECGFKAVVAGKYGVRMWHRISDVFDQLPIAAVVEGRIFCVHGGLPSKAADSLTLDEIRSLRKGDVDGWAFELLWNDSSPAKGMRDNLRGPGTYTFGADVTRKFTEHNNLKAVIRAHDVRMSGYSIEHANRLMTVFSAPNYCGIGNMAAFFHVPGAELTARFGLKPSHCITFCARENQTPKTLAALRARVVAASTRKPGPKKPAKTATAKKPAKSARQKREAEPKTPAKAAKRARAGDSETPPKKRARTASPAKKAG